MNYIEKLQILDECLPGAVAQKLEAWSKKQPSTPIGFDAQGEVQAYSDGKCFKHYFFTEWIAEYSSYAVEKAIDAAWKQFHDKAQAETFALPADFQGDAQ